MTATTLADGRVPSWDAPGWFSAAPVPEDLPEGSTPEAVDAALARFNAGAGALLSRATGRLRDAIFAPLPDPVRTDTAAWSDLTADQQRAVARAWRVDTSRVPEVRLGGLAMTRRGALLHADKRCTKLNHAHVDLSAWTGYLDKFSEQALCTTCFAYAPPEVAHLFALASARRALRRSDQLFTPTGASQLGSGRKDVLDVLARLEDVSGIIADVDPDLARLCQGVAGAARTSYGHWAQQRRTHLHAGAGALLAVCDGAAWIDPETVARATRTPARVHLQGSGWFSGKLWQLRDLGAVFDLGRRSLTWETTAASALLLLHLSGGEKSRAITVETDDESFKLACLLAADDPYRIVDQWPVADAVLC